MIIRESENSGTLTLFLEGDLDPVTSPELETLVRTRAPEISKLILDCSMLTMLTAAGLRALSVIALLMEQKSGKLMLRGCSSSVVAVLEATGFNSVFSCC